jgi:hypothetical protein
MITEEFVDEFISEDDLPAFEGWLRYQAIDAAAIAQEELATWRRIFEEARQRSVANPKVGLMKLQPVPGEFRYAVAVKDVADLRLTLWVKRSRKASFSYWSREAIESGTFTRATISTAPRT